MACRNRWATIAAPLRRTAAVALLLAAGAPTEAALPPEIARRLDAGIADMKKGRPADAHDKFRFLLERDDPPLHREIEASLKKKKIDGKLGDVTAKLRIDVVNAGGASAAKSLRPMGASEAGFVQTAVESRIQTLLEPVDKELQIRFRADAPVDALEEQLHRCTTLLDQMEVVQRLQSLLTAANKHANGAPRQDAKKDDAQHQARADQLIVRIVEIALTVIPDLLEILRDDGAEYAARAQAVARLEDALALAKKYYPRYKTAKKGKAAGGRVGEAFAALKRNEQEFDRAAGGLRLKMYHFEQGKLWWLRGRWGVGAYHDGLTKAVVGRPNLDAFLFAQVMMPNPIAKPLNPLQDPRPFPWARRHLEVWKASYPAGPAFERVERNLAIAKLAWKTDQLPPGLARINYAKAVDSDDSFNPFVGYLEYQMALYHWGQLISLAGEAELGGLDKAIADDERFAVPSYLSRQYDHIEPESSLRLNPPKSDDPRVTDAYERRGLAWCIALAQIEIGGIRATYSGLEYEPDAGSHDPNEPGAAWLAGNSSRLRRTVRPFDRLVITPFNRRAVAEVLWDGMRQQYYRVKTEVIIEAGRISAPSEFLAPVVRLAVALEFIRGYRKQFAHTLTPVQLAELARWQRELEVALNQLWAAWSNNLRAGVEAWKTPVKGKQR
jgi:hypothetical protein